MATWTCDETRTLVHAYCKSIEALRPGVGAAYKTFVALSGGHSTRTKSSVDQRCAFIRFMWSVITEFNSTDGREQQQLQQQYSAFDEEQHQQQHQRSWFALSDQQKRSVFRAKVNGRSHHYIDIDAAMFAQLDAALTRPQRSALSVVSSDDDTPLASPVPHTTKRKRTRVPTEVAAAVVAKLPRDSNIHDTSHSTRCSSCRTTDESACDCDRDTAAAVASTLDRRKLELEAIATSLEQLEHNGAATTGRFTYLVECYERDRCTVELQLEQLVATAAAAQRTWEDERRAFEIERLQHKKEEDEHE